MALDALVLGDNCVDLYLPPVDRSFVGGQAVNVAVGLAAAGLAVGYAGVVGTDAAGRRVLAELVTRGIDVSVVESRTGATGVTVIASEAGERRFVSEQYGVSAPYLPSPRALALVAEVHLAYATHVHRLAEIRAALRPAALLALDASDGPLHAAELSLVDVAFVSRPGASTAEAWRVARSVLRCGPAIAVVTRGARGVVVAGHGGVEVVRPALSATPVDTLGAGDALAAGALAAILRGATLAQALDQGLRAAAEACSHIGALPEPGSR